MSIWDRYSHNLEVIGLISAFLGIEWLSHSCIFTSLAVHILTFIIQFMIIFTRLNLLYLMIMPTDPILVILLIIDVICLIKEKFQVYK